MALLRTFPVEEGMNALRPFFSAAWNVGVMTGIPAAILGHLEGKPHDRKVGQGDGRILSLGHRGVPTALGCLPGSGLPSQDKERGTHLLKPLLGATKPNPYEPAPLSFRNFLGCLSCVVFHVSLRISLFNLKISPVSF